MTDTNTTTTKRQPVTVFEYEVTDTFGGEANYCWVRRGTVRARSLRGAITAAKRREGIACRHTTDSYGGGDGRVDFARGGWLACMFITGVGDAVDEIPLFPHKRRHA